MQKNPESGRRGIEQTRRHREAALAVVAIHDPLVARVLGLLRFARNDVVVSVSNHGPHFYSAA
jgi:hypothetical protein